MKFSQRIGKTPVQKLSQHESMDVELTNSLWSAMQLFYWDHYDVLESSNMCSVSIRLWLYYYKEPIDSLPLYFSSFLSEVSKHQVV
ncbi:AbiJ-NTD4 domain-containing protein [Vibrio metschnikovii]|uniref:AbiJ-NTD4 domain-containing protein n=1 Tax=Vibrio metschnikovii TaxID=28172 RepID=UPI0039F1DA00